MLAPPSERAPTCSHALLIRLLRDPRSHLPAEVTRSCWFRRSSATLAKECDGFDGGDGWSLIKAGDELKRPVVCVVWESCNMPSSAAAELQASAVLDGSITLRASCSHVVSEAKGLLLFLAVFSMIHGSFLLIWTALQGKHPAMRLAQSRFLLVVLVGFLVSTSSLFFIAVDDDAKPPETYTAVPANGTSNTSAAAAAIGTASWQRVDAACMIQPWLYWIGFSFSFSTLLAKTWRVSALLKGVAALRVVKITVGELVVKIAMVITVFASILGAWTAIDPLVWVRSPSDLSGTCTTLTTGWAFVAPLLAVQGFLYLFAIHLLFKARDIHTLFAETKYITWALVSQSQVFAIAIPILIMLGDQPNAFAVVKGLGVFLTENAMVMLIFWPKMHVVHFFPKEDISRMIQDEVTSMGAKAMGGTAASKRNLTAVTPTTGEVTD